MLITLDSGLFSSIMRILDVHGKYLWEFRTVVSTDITLQQYVHIYSVMAMSTTQFWPCGSASCQVLRQSKEGSNSNIFIVIPITWSHFTRAKLYSELHRVCNLWQTYSKRFTFSQWTLNRPESRSGYRSATCADRDTPPLWPTCSAGQSSNKWPGNWLSNILPPRNRELLTRRNDSRSLQRMRLPPGSGLMSTCEKFLGVALGLSSTLSLLRTHSLG